MKPVTPFDNFPSFGNTGARQAPGDAKYAQGFLAADTLPAEWANYFFHGSTKGISDLNTAVRSIWLELSSVLTAYNITADASQTDQLYQAIEKRLRSLYPVGTIYQNADSYKNPGASDMLGFGTWEQITDKFLAARGSTNIGESGGAWNFTLNANNIPRHRHQVNNHTHNMVHSHNRGTMDIQGSLATVLFTSPQGTYTRGAVWGNGGAFSTVLDVTQTSWALTAQTDAYGGAWTMQFKASDFWTGTTSDPLNAQGYVTNTGGATPYTDYQYAESPAAVSITPTYVGVYTWKRTA